VLKLVVVKAAEQVEFVVLPPVQLKRLKELVAVWLTDFVAGGAAKS